MPRRANFPCTLGSTNERGPEFSRELAIAASESSELAKATILSQPPVDPGIGRRLTIGPTRVKMRSGNLMQSGVPSAVNLCRELTLISDAARSLFPDEWKSTDKPN